MELNNPSLANVKEYGFFDFKAYGCSAQNDKRKYRGIKIENNSFPGA